MYTEEERAKFRQRFAAWKDGKKPYEAGLPVYKGGKTPHEEFVEQMGPVLYKELLRTNTPNIDTAYDHMLRQLAYESDYGRSRVARQQHNYGGYGWNGKTYTTFKDDEDFVRHYVQLMNNRYGTAVNADSVQAYGKALKDKGYYEDTLANYTRNLVGMKSLSRSAAAHRQSNPNLYQIKPLALTPAAEQLESAPQFQPVNIVVPEVNTDYSLQNASMQSPAPQAINAWKGKGSPAYGGYSLRMPSIEEYMQTGNVMSRGFKDGKLPGYRLGTWGDSELKESVQEWGRDWKTRTTAAGGSKVLQKWNATKVKPNAESSEEYTKRRVAEETKMTPITRAVGKVMDIPTEVQVSPGTATSYPSFGQYMPKTQSTIGTEVGNLLNIFTAPVMMSDLSKMYSLLKNPVSTLRPIKQSVIDTAKYMYKNPYYALRVVDENIQPTIGSMTGVGIGDTAINQWLDKEDPDRKHSTIDNGLRIFGDIFGGSLGAMAGYGLKNIPFTKILGNNGRVVNDIVRHPFTTLAAVKDGKYLGDFKRWYNYTHQLTDDVRLTYAIQSNAISRNMPFVPIQLRKPKYVVEGTLGEFNPNTSVINLNTTAYKDSNIPATYVTYPDNGKYWRGMINHEYRHAIQNYHPTIQYSRFDPDKGYYVIDDTHPIADVFKPLEKYKKGEWTGSPDEFDAEISNLQRAYANTSEEFKHGHFDLHPLTDKDISFLSDRFGVSKKDARNMVDAIIKQRQSYYKALSWDPYLGTF